MEHLSASLSRQSMDSGWRELEVFSSRATVLIIDLLCFDLREFCGPFDTEKIDRFKNPNDNRAAGHC